MRGRIAATVLVAFAATSAFASHSSGGHSSGGHSSGGHSSGGHSSGPHSSSGHHSSQGHVSGTHGSASHAWSGHTHSSGLSDAQRRQPRAGHRSAARFHVPRYYPYYPYYPYFSYDPYYRSDRYYPYAWGYRGLGVGFSVDNGYYAPYDYGSDPAYGPDSRDWEDRGDAEAYADRDERRDERGPRSQDATLRTGGELRLTLRPTDATVYVDGEFRGTALQARTLWLATGHHRIEMVRPGFRTAERDVGVSPGSPALLEVDLERP